MDDFDPILLDRQRAQENHPEVSQRRRDHQARQPYRIRQMTLVQMKVTSMASSSTHHENRLTRLSRFVLSGACLVISGKWVRRLPTMPLTSPANVFRWRARFPCGSVGYNC
jgi:hypothetical protein